jgi:prepilin-type N-terminal cleavage/methylation domain-containing protein
MACHASLGTGFTPLRARDGSIEEMIREMGRKGFTVVEILIALVVAGILIGAAMPSFLGLIERSRIDAATRQLVSEIRAVQSLAVTRGGVFGLHWGGDPFVGMSTNLYRLERDGTGACGWPAPTDTMATNANVIRDWRDLSIEYPGITITAVQDNGGTTLGGVMFNSVGASVNTCGGVNFPVTITVADGTGGTRIIQVRSAGSVRIL